MIAPSSIPFFRRAFLPHRPAGHARMTEGDDPRKYYRVHQPITDRLILDHFDGRLTLGCQQQRDGRGYMAAADIDSGGIAHLVELLQRCSDRGLWAFAIAVHAGEHDGGHLFIPFQLNQDAAVLQQLAGEITNAPELYPSNADLRLPFGMHRRAWTRGILLLPDGTQHDLDSDLAEGFALLESCWQPNGGQLPPSAPSSSAPSVPSAPACSTRGNPRSSHSDSPRTLVPAILDQFDIEDRLQHYQARKGPGRLYYCPFHDDRDPSLVIFTDHNRIKCCRCLSKQSACPLAEHNRNDVINLVAIGEQISIGEATRRLGDELRAARPVPACLTSRPARSAAQLDQPARSTSQPARPAAQLDQRQTPRHPAPQQKAANLAELRKAALLDVMSDSSLPPCARETYKALDQTAGNRGLCSVAVGTLALRSNQDKRSVQRGLRILENQGLVDTQQRYGQTSRYFLSWLPDGPDAHGVIERSPNMLVVQDAFEGGASGHESHDRGRRGFSQDGPAPAVEQAGAGELVEQADEQARIVSSGDGRRQAPAVELVGALVDLVELASIASVDDGGPRDPIAIAGDVIPDSGPGLVEPAGASEQADESGFFWTPERLHSFARMRAGPPRLRPGQRQRREKQARFTTLAGELPKRLANAPPGPLPAPAPLITTIADSLDQAAASSEAPKNPQQRGKRALRGCPPSQASTRFNPWSLPDDDPWLVQQRRALAGAVERGDQDRIRFYRDLFESIGRNP
jgi:hypothetical protein